VQKIESSFNHIWHVHLPRSLGERFSNYLSVLMIGPILVFSALAVTAGIATNALWQQRCSRSASSPRGSDARRRTCW